MNHDRQYHELQERYQIVRRQYEHARQRHETLRQEYVAARDRFIAMFRQTRPRHAAKIQAVIGERNLPQPQEAFARIAGILAVRRGPTEV